MVVEEGLDAMRYGAPRSHLWTMSVGQCTPTYTRLSELPAMSPPPTATLIHHQSRR
jgi:hypothetical protein